LSGYLESSSRLPREGGNVFSGTPLRGNDYFFSLPPHNVPLKRGSKNTFVPERCGSSIYFLFYQFAQNCVNVNHAYEARTGREHVVAHMLRLAPGSKSVTVFRRLLDLVYG